MAVTVRQCLELPSLAEAEVIAGAGGLDRPVRGISVLESAGVPEYITEDIMLGDEIVITGFISHRTDVDRQCQIIRILNEGGEAALILFYVGIFMPEVSQKLIDTANELDFPLIRMPLNRVDIPYSEVINEVMELLFRRKLRSNAWLGDPERESEAELVQVILDDDKLGMLRLERKMGADQMAIRDMRVLMRENDAIRLDAGRTMLEAVRAHYRASGIRAYAALYDGALVVLIPSSTGRPRGNDADHLMQAVREPDIVLAVVDGMADLNELRGHHALIRRTLQPARQIFRTKNVFNRHDLGFVDNVLRIVAGGAETTRPYSSLVKKIREHGEDGAGRLYETLETLILDANMSTAATASLLYLHQHTVQYRLRKIKDLLGDDVFQVSTQFELATALAIQRLLEGKKQRK